MENQNTISAGKEILYFFIMAVIIPLYLTTVIFYIIYILIENWLKITWYFIQTGVNKLNNFINNNTNY